jgi:ABC-2 type transport system permease protein
MIQATVSGLDRLPIASRFTDAIVIARRDLTRTMRTPQAAVAAVTSPILFLVLLWVVFAGAIHVPGMTYVEYLVPAMLVQNLVFAGVQAASALAVDVNSGIIDRFRSLPTPRAAPLLGRSLSDLVTQSLATVLTILAGVAVGLRFHTSAPSYLIGAGLLVLMSLSLFWVFALLGLVTRNPETVQSATPVFFLLLFVSNAFVPADTLPGWLRGFASNQPISIFNDALRALTQGPGAAAALGHGAGYYVIASILWCASIAAAFGTAALRAYRRL